MKIIFLLSLFMAANSLNVLCQQGTDNRTITLRATNLPVDSNILIVINGKTAGTIRELNKDLYSFMTADLIEQVHALKGNEAIEKYGEKGKSGVLEFKLKKVTISDATLSTDTTEDPEVSGNKIFEKVEIEASFPGGDAAWRKYLEKNLDASIPVKNNAPEGTYTVIVQFIVDKEGNISEVKALTKHGYGMEAEVIRVIRKGPKWSPAIQDGRMVKAYRKQPVTFMVIIEKKPKKKKDKD